MVFNRVCVADCIWRLAACSTPITNGNQTRLGWQNWLNKSTRGCPKNLEGSVLRVGLSQEWTCPKSGPVPRGACPKSGPVPRVGLSQRHVPVRSRKGLQVVLHTLTRCPGALTRAFLGIVLRRSVQKILGGRTRRSA
jgi:hypothetical protein